MAERFLSVRETREFCGVSASMCACGFLKAGCADRARGQEELCWEK